MIDSSTLATLNAIAIQCPYAAGDAVYFARALYAQYVDTLYYDDMVLCQPSLEEESYKVPNYHDTININNEFVKVYPNPTKDLINLVYFAATTGPVEFEIFDQLGNVVMMESLGGTQNFAQYSTQILSSGIYYWQLKDSEKIIKTDKVAIIK